jgi:putative ABC transport system permease protein
MIFDLDNWREIFDALRGNKLRTFLTAFGVFWGLFMLMVMLGSGNGLQNGVYQDFSGAATNSFFVWTERTSMPYRGLPPGRYFNLNNEDKPAIEQRVPDARIVCPRNQLGGFRGGNNVTRGTRAGAFSVMGDYSEIQYVQSIPIERGRFLNPFDLEERRKVAVIGSRVREVLFTAEEDPVGGHIRINGVYFKVVGVFRSNGSGDDAERETQTIYIPFTTFQTAFNYGDRVGWFAITSRDNVPASVVEEQVLALLKQRHRVAPDDERAFGHFNLEEEFNEIKGLFAGIRGLIWIVGIGTLAAGVIGVSNIMLIIVRERTNEIGIRRAVGASPFSIMSQVILEAIILTSVAGYLGLMAGMGLMDLVNSWMATSGVNASMFKDPGVQLENALQALSILILAGMLAGIIPARRAIRISPVAALRTEA